MISEILRLTRGGYRNKYKSSATGRI